MTFIQLFRASLFVAVTAGLALPQAQAAGTACIDLFANDPGHTGVLRTRKSIIDEVRAKGIPAFLKETKHGPIPVILLTKQTATSLQAFMESSVGTMILLMPDRGTDHGMLRIGGVKNSATAFTASEKVNVQVDWVQIRFNDENNLADLNASGVRWTDLDWRLAEAERTGHYSKVGMEVAYSVTPQERSAIEYYQRMRRANMYGIPAVQPDGHALPIVTNKLNATEQCFTFCRGNDLGPHIDAIELELQSLGIQNPRAFLARPATQRYLAAARTKLMEADWLKRSQLNERMLVKAELIRLLTRAVSPTILKGSTDRAQNIGNWLVALDSSIQAQTVFTALGVSSDVSVHLDTHLNKRATAVLIYASPNEATRFVDATFSASGFYGYTGWGKDERGTQPFDDQYPLYRSGGSQ